MRSSAQRGLACSEDQAEKYMEMSQGAAKEARAIEDTSKDYDVAGLAAAKYFMARALPPDVPPPLLPMVPR